MFRRLQQFVPKANPFEAVGLAPVVLLHAFVVSSFGDFPKTHNIHLRWIVVFALDLCVRQIMEHSG